MNAKEVFRDETSCCEKTGQIKRKFKILIRSIHLPLGKSYEFFVTTSKFVEGKYSVFVQANEWLRKHPKYLQGRSCVCGTYDLNILSEEEIAEKSTVLDWEFVAETPTDKFEQMLAARKRYLKYLETKQKRPKLENSFLKNIQQMAIQETAKKLKLQ